MANLLLPDFAGDAMRAYAFGNDMRRARKAENDQDQLRSLAPNLLAGDPIAFQQAAAINPQAAVEYDDAGAVMARQSAGLAKFLLEAYDGGRGDPAEVQRRYDVALPFLGKMAQAHGQQPPGPQFDAAAVPLMQRFVAEYEARRQGGQAGNVQSTYRDRDGNRVAILRDGTQRVLGPDDPGMSKQTLTVTGPDGRPRQVTFDKREASYTPAEFGAPAAMQAPAAPTQFTAPDGRAVSIDPNLPANIQAAIRADPLGWNGAPDGATANLPPQNTGSPFVGRSPEEQAALTEAARQRAQLQYLPAQQAIEAQGAGMTTAAQEAARAQAAAQYGTESSREAARDAAKKLPQLQNAMRGLDRIDAALNALDGGRFVDTGPLDQYAQRPTKEGQELEAAVGAIQNSVLALTRVPGVGSQSDLEARMAALQYPSLDKAPEVNRRTMANLRAFMQDLQQAYQNVTAGGRGQAPAVPAGAAPAPARSQSGGVDDLLSKYGVR